MNKSELKLALVFEQFAKINEIPRPSKHEENMIEFLKSFGEVKRLRPLFFLHRIRNSLAYTQIVPPAPLAVYFPCLPLSTINGRLAGKRNTLFIPYPSLSSPVNTVNEPTRLPKEESGKAKPCFCLCVHAEFSHPPCIGCRCSFSTQPSDDGYVLVALRLY